VVVLTLGTEVFFVIMLLMDNKKRSQNILLYTTLLEHGSASQEVTCIISTHFALFILFNRKYAKRFFLKYINIIDVAGVCKTATSPQHTSMPMIFRKSHVLTFGNYLSPLLDGVVALRTR
jgi:hypothetical protein